MNDAVKDAFINFMLTACLGELSSCPSLKSVHQKLGLADIVEEKREAVPNQVLMIHYYDDLEIVYLDDTFLKFTIRIPNQRDLRVPDALDVSWTSALKGFNYSSFKEFVISEDVACQEVVVYPSLSAEEIGYMVEAQKTRMRFSFNPKPLYNLRDIHYEAQLSGKWIYKPLS